MILRTKGLYSSGMVVQHNKISRVHGLAPKNSLVELDYQNQKLSTKSDDEGLWQLDFDGGEAGGPYLFKISCGDEKIEYQIYSGEVWLSSGQSNAQLPMERMKFSYPDEFELPENPLVRMVTVPITWNLDGECDDFYMAPGTLPSESADSSEKKSIPIKWDSASPKTLGSMSGTAYFFAKKLAADLNMPVGIISVAQGGSPISAWLSKNALQEIKCDTDYLSELEKYESPEAVSLKQKELKENQSKWDQEVYTLDEGVKNHWENLSYDECSDWKECSIPGFLNNFSSAGIVWIKKEITLTKEQLQHFNSYKTWLWLGTIVDADKVYVNGSQVGVTYYCYPPRRYPVEKGLLKEGKNTITVRLQKNSSNGKIRFYQEKPYYLFTENVKIAPSASRNVENFKESCPDDGEKISLSGKWLMKVGCSVRDCPSGMFFEWLPTALYNGMLSPCFTQAIAGALWYQGESDAGRAHEYKNLLLGLMRLWRKKFTYAKKEVPFVIVQLPNWSDGMAETSVCENGGWAYLRYAQNQVVEKDPNSALVVSIDAGEWNDLHPEKKRTTGSRAAEQALRLVYKKSYFICPKIICIEKKEGAIIAHFDCGKDSLKAFALKEDGKSADLSKEASEVYGFVFVVKRDGKITVEAAHAELTAECEVTVTLPKDSLVKELRYLWADNPAPVNLYNSHGSPAAPFFFRIS
ncbi:MAG: sialate O-acetylesterase [Treponema sp.]|nr:sialate O-acetylesterase [Treponema sp.]